MAIVRFAFRDRASGWCLTGGPPLVAVDALPPPVEFDRVNLLVGPSGAGKSRTLEALRQTIGAALGRAPLPDREWAITVELDGNQWTWTARTAARGDDHSDRPAQERGAHFAVERLTDAEGTLIAELTEAGEARLGGQPGARLKRSESILSLFEREPAVAPALRAFRRAPQRLEFSLMVELVRQAAQPTAANVPDLEALRSLPESLLTRVWLMEARFPQAFAEVVAQYKDIFPTVEAVAVRRGPSQHSTPEGTWDQLDLEIREQGVDRPLGLGDLSGGMHRALSLLFQIALAPAGAVVMVDEIENSLGINCLDEVVDALTGSGRGLQLIMTSHHPYVVNAIPRSAWKVVTRRGGIVSLQAAAAFPRLAGRSQQDAFIQLINTPEYQHGVQ